MFGGVGVRRLWQAVHVLGYVDMHVCICVRVFLIRMNYRATCWNTIGLIEVLPYLLPYSLFPFPWIAPPSWR